MLVDVPGPLPSIANGELQRFLREKSAPQLPEVFRPAFLEAVARGDVKSMPNRTMPASIVHREGALLLGDALNMRHPITGGGMTVAIKVRGYGRLLLYVSFGEKALFSCVVGIFGQGHVFCPLFMKPSRCRFPVFQLRRIPLRFNFPGFIFFA